MKNVFDLLRDELGLIVKFIIVFLIIFDIATGINYSTLIMSAVIFYLTLEVKDALDKYLALKNKMYEEQKRKADGIYNIGKLIKGKRQRVYKPDTNQQGNLKGNK